MVDICDKWSITLPKSKQSAEIHRRRYTGPSAADIAARLPGSSRPDSKGYRRLRAVCHGKGDMPHNQTLSVWDRREGGLAVKCFAGCPRRAIIEALEQATGWTIWEAWETIHAGAPRPPQGPQDRPQRPVSGLSGVQALKPRNQASALLPTSSVGPPHAPFPLTRTIPKDRCGLGIH